MPDGLHIAAIGLDFAAGFLACYWAVGLGRVLAAMIRIPTARAGLALPREQASVCVIVPAHNEQSAIGPLVRSLRAQTAERLHIVLCLDRCTDGTREAAADAIEGDPRFTILETADCPDGWAGKVHAAHQGSISAPARAADLLLFLDADTVLEPRCVDAAAALLRARDVDLLSLLSTLGCRRWFELVVQPAAAMELVRQYPIVRANRRVRRRAFANGQFMLFRREAYDAIGGHAGVRGELLEDLALARAMAVAGRPAGVHLAAGMVTCRMYEGYAAFCSGWKRIYTESTHRKVRRLRVGAACNILCGAVLVAGALANVALSVRLLDEPGDGGPLGAVGLWLSGAGLILWLAVVAISYRISRVPLWAIPAYPIGALLVGKILLGAVRDLKRGVPTAWGGRTYIRTAR